MRVSDRCFPVSLHPSVFEPVLTSGRGRVHPDTLEGNIAELSHAIPLNRLGIFYLFLDPTPLTPREQRRDGLTEPRCLVVAGMENQIATRPACLDTTDTSSSLKSSKSFFENIIRKDRKVSPTAQVETPKGRYGLTTLYEPSDQNVVADLIFVHGLNGGSQSTWMKGDESTFWPKAWLPSDDAFRDVRIHTFGYHSDLSKESVLHVQDFSRALLGAIHDAPCMASAEQVSDIFQNIHDPA